MVQKDPYSIIKKRHVTEKATVLSSLKDLESNASLRKCKSPKYVFIVDPSANKVEIASAIEEIYSSRGVKVAKVNTITVKPKQYARRGNRRPGSASLMKKAIVTFQRGDKIED
ncbi:MAG TPA: 50S ribosomal protein L23 [Chlamydiales bacterium]|nr:50S ribosomal protein L23 [Chlamydiales bacterium]